MKADEFLTTILDPGLRVLADIGGPRPNDDARRFMLCISFQESGPELDARYQSSPSSSPGPARGWWQFEQGGGVTGVLNHSVSQSLAKALCSALHVQTNPAAVWRALEGNDMLATGFARLLIFTDPYAIPTQEEPAWDCYANRLWRPGAPHHDTWHNNWVNADAAVRASLIA